MSLFLHRSGILGGAISAGGGGGGTTETLVFNDTFAEAVNTRIEDHTPDLGTGWTNRTTPGDYQILASTDQLWTKFTSTAADITDVISADQAVQVNILDNSNFNGVIARATFAGSGWSNFDGYGAFHNGSTVSLYSFDAALGVTLIDSVTLTFSSGELIRLECFGTSLKVLVGGVEQISATNSDWSAGKPGLRSSKSSSGVVFDNFKVYELT